MTTKMTEKLKWDRDWSDRMKKNRQNSSSPNEES